MSTGDPVNCYGGGPCCPCARCPRRCAPPPWYQPYPWWGYYPPPPTYIVPCGDSPYYYTVTTGTPGVATWADNTESDA